MRLWPKSLKWRTILLTLLGLAGLIGTALCVWWEPITGYVSQQLAVIRFWNDPDPLTRGLARGEIREGSPVDELIVAHPPEDILIFDRYTKLRYSGVTVLAKDGRLVYAFQHAERATIFSSISDAELWNYASAYANYAVTNSRLVNEQGRWHRFYEDDAHSAVAGVAGYTSTADWFQERARLPRTSMIEP